MVATLDLAIIGGFLISTLIIGFYFGKKVTTVQEYATGGRNFTTPVLVATIFATWIGGETVLGLSAEVFAFGIAFVLVFFGSTISDLLMAYYVAPRITRFLGMISVGEIMGSLYGKPGRVITGFSGAILCVGQLGGQIAAMGYLFHYFFEVSHIYGVLLGCGIVIFYSTFGGIRAVTYTDVFQFMVLIIAIPIITGMGLQYVGGFDQLIAKLPQAHMQFFPNHKNSFNYITLFLIFLVPFLSPYLTQRLLMAKDENQMKTAMYTSALIQIPFFIIVGIIGLIVYAIDKEVPSGAALPYLISTILPVGMKGLAISGIIAVIMSSADSVLNAAGIALVHDVIKPMRKNIMGNEQELFWIRIITFCLGCMSVYIALNFKDAIELMVTFLSCWGPMIVVPLYAGLFKAKGSPRCFVLSALTGLTVVMSWSLFEIETYLGVGALVPAMLANFLVFMLTKDPSSSSLTFPERIGLFLQRLHPSVICKRVSRNMVVYGGVVYEALQFSQRQIADSSLQASRFGGFAILMCVAPYFLLTENDSYGELSMVLRMLGGGLCVGVLLRDSWGVHGKRYFPWYFQMTLLYCLPFLTTFMLLVSQGSLLWTANSVAALFLLGLLVNWLSFSLILPIGIIIAGGLFSLLPGSPGIHWTGDTISAFSYGFVLVTVVVILFFRNKELAIEQKYTTLKTLGGTIAHELRTPLASISLGISGMQKYQPELIKGYRQLQQNPDFASAIDDEQLKYAEKLPDRLLSDVRRSHTFIDMVLMQLKDIKGQKLDNIISMKQCVEESLEAYPFVDNSEDLVECHIENEFLLHGQDELMQHVIFNLLKNSLYQIQASRKGKIQIWSSQDEIYNLLHFKDTASGIAAEKLPFIFEKFYTQSHHGTGIGLAFCQHVIESFNGRISCTSVEGEYTEFVMSFPKLQPDALGQNIAKDNERMAA